MSPTKSLAAPWLAARGVVKSFGGVQALRGVDLALAAGEVRGLVGPNGAGKSTLVGVLSGAVAPDAGGLEIDGSRTTGSGPAAALAHGIVLMPQKLTLVAEASITDNVTLGRETSRLSVRMTRADHRRAARACHLAGLDVDVRRTANDLGPVEQRLLMLARALDHDPRLLILDEPTAGLPPSGSEVVISAVRRLAETTDVTIVYVSHHLTEVADLCDSVTCIREGRVYGELVGDDVTKAALVDLIVDAPAMPEIKSPIPPTARVTTETTVGRAAKPPVRLELVGVTDGALVAPTDTVIESGGVVGLTGLVGAGVDELVGLITGTRRRTAGQVFLDGKELAVRSPSDALSKGIGHLAGERTETAFPELTVRQNVAISSLPRWAGRGGALTQAREREGVRPFLDQLSVQVDPETDMSALSGGNQQRALLARLLAADLRAIVVESPTVGVDIRARQELWDALRDLARDRVVVIASSEPEELVALCVRVVCLRHGAVVAQLTGDAITERHVTDAVS